MGTIRINGSTSGYVELVAPATAGTTTVTLPSSSTSLVNATPFGAVLPFAGSTAPDGWLLCYGQAISRTTYAGLFAVISTTYGTGDGSTTFNVPDMRGRVAAGVDDMGGSAANRLTTTVLDKTSAGGVGGTQTHILTEAQMPSHTHIQNTHNHVGLVYQGGGAVGILTGGSHYNLSYGGSGANNSTNIHTQGATPTNQSTGGGSAHLNTQPTIVLNYIIKAL